MKFDVEVDTPLGPRNTRYVKTKILFTALNNFHIIRFH